MNVKGGVRMFIKPFGSNRRQFLQATAATGVIAGLGPRIARAEEWTCAVSMRSLANPYHATFAKGAETFAKSAGAPFEMLVTEGNS
ncbi:MAG: sugar ABC transporter substrate-binding protein, partial [Geminicoccaceae bacterium]|nr:sugar ABC transporter substrate-binding protein [Geminicoccaceae bacterium]